MNYVTYRMRWREYLKYGGVFLVIFLILAKAFYDSFWMSIAGFLFLPFLLRRQAGILAQKRRERLALEFKDFILSFSASLKTGYSVENAFTQAYRDLCLIYDDRRDMVIECQKISNQMKNNQILEELLSDFAKRSGQDDIRDFAAVFCIAKRSGGNLAAIIQNTAATIVEKIEIKREINLMFASKRMEQNVMNLIPVLIIGYIRFTTPGYFDSLYQSLFGKLLMTACLVVYVTAFFLSQKIMHIEV